MNEKQIIFIVGCPRSGTTLLRDILISDKRIAIPDEELQVVPKLIEHLNSNSIENVRSLLKRSPYGFFHPDFDFNGLHIEGNELHHKWVALFSQLTKNGNADFYGEKTPENYMNIDFLVNHFPSAKILFVMRDPRDVVMSMRKAWGKSYLLAVKKWKGAYQEYIKAKEYADISCIFYEQLLSDPSASIDQVGRWLECEGLSQVTLENFVQSKEVYGDSKGEKGIVSTNSKKYLKSAPKFVHYSIEQHLFKEMKNLGYETDFVEKKSHIFLFQFYLYSLWDIPVSYVRTIYAQVKHKGLVSGVKYKFLQVMNKDGNF